MIQTNSKFRAVLCATLVRQLLAALAAGLAGWWLGGTTGAAAGLFGGAMAMLNSLLAARRLQGSLSDLQRGGDGAMALYMGAVERFVLTGAGFVIGMGLLKLSPPLLLAGFALAAMVNFTAPGLASLQAGGGQKAEESA